MALGIQHVQPGELITALLLNKVIDELGSLEARIAMVEAGGSGSSGAVQITDVYPKPARAREDVTILGRNFGLSVGAARVRFNGVSPTVFRVGSNDIAIICDVPDLQGLAEGGSNVELLVSNAQTTDVRTITVLPARREQVGDASILFDGVTPDPTVPGQDADFEFLLNSDASLPATLTITPTVTIAGRAAGWPMSVLDAAKKPIGDRRITLNPGDTKPFWIRVGIPGNAGETAFVLRVDAAGGGLTASSGALNLTIGQEESPDPAIKDLTPVRATGGTLSGSRVSVKKGVLAEVFVEAQFAVAPATYDVTFAALAGTSGWTTAIFVPPASDPKIDVAPADLTEPGPPPYAQTSIRVRVKPGEAASAAGQALLIVQRRGETRKRTYIFDLAVGP
jgi:hypothetical protein